MKNEKPSITEEILKKQLDLLHLQSKDPHISPEGLAELTNAMLNIARYLDCRD